MTTISSTDRNASRKLADDAEAFAQGEAATAAAIEEVAVALSRCSAQLFAPNGMVFVWSSHGRTLVSPEMVPYLMPVQGPAPLVCARDSHPDSPWHWDGKGTWWR